MLHQSLPTTKKGTQGLMGFFTFWKQHIPRLDVLRCCTYERLGELLVLSWAQNGEHWELLNVSPTKVPISSAILPPHRPPQRRFSSSTGWKGRYFPFSALGTMPSHLLWDLDLRLYPFLPSPHCSPSLDPTTNTWTCSRFSHP